MKNIFEENFLVDTNLLVYYLDKNSEFHSLVKDFILTCVRRKKLFFIAQQNLIELLSVLINGYKIKKPSAIVRVDRFAQRKLVQVVTPLPTTFSRCLKLVGEIKSNDIFDAFLAATALDNGIKHVVTNNARDFSGMKGVKIWSLEEVEKALHELRTLGGKIGGEYD